jgi:hypothetical protein
MHNVDVDGFQGGTGTVLCNVAVTHHFDAAPAPRPYLICCTACYITREVKKIKFFLVFHLSSFLKKKNYAYRRINKLTITGGFLKHWRISAATTTPASAGCQASGRQIFPRPATRPG